MPPYLLHRMRLAGRLLVVLSVPYMIRLKMTWRAGRPEALSSVGDGNLQSQALHKTDHTSNGTLSLAVGP